MFVYERIEKKEHDTRGCGHARTEEKIAGPAEMGSVH